MSKVEGLPGSFKWDDDGINWVTNYLKNKSSTYSTNEEISALIKQYYDSNIGLGDTEDQFENLIAEILKTGDSGKLFINKLNATWRARYAREGKKHYNLSLDSDTYRNLKSLTKSNSTYNASIKQTLTELINDEYQTKIEADKKKKSQNRAALDHKSQILAKETEKKITNLTKSVETLKAEIAELQTSKSDTPPSETSTSELEEELAQVKLKNIELVKQVSKYAQEISKLGTQSLLSTAMNETQKKADDNQLKPE
ncbi:hypothetical protein [Vibrio atlanticus]|uniref:hypothetical protein n=1 Tax=Vibrio atlanticus TaxID=693153 RepID=UPI00354B0281